MRRDLLAFSTREAIGGKTSTSDGSINERSSLAYADATAVACFRQSSFALNSEQSLIHRMMTRGKLH